MALATAPEPADGGGAPAAPAAPAFGDALDGAQPQGRGGVLGLAVRPGDLLLQQGQATHLELRRRLEHEGADEDVDGVLGAAARDDDVAHERDAVADGDDAAQRLAHVGRARRALQRAQVAPEGPHQPVVHFLDGHCIFFFWISCGRH